MLHTPYYYIAKFILDPALSVDAIKAGAGLRFPEFENKIQVRALNDYPITIDQALQIDSSGKLINLDDVYRFCDIDDFFEKSLEFEADSKSTLVYNYFYARGQEESAGNKLKHEGYNVKLCELASYQVIAKSLNLEYYDSEDDYTPVCEEKDPTVSITGDSESASLHDSTYS
ncbi:MAG: hypothetical protein RLN62_05570 [Rickettsiales bacterium]